MIPRYAILSLVILLLVAGCQTARPTATGPAGTGTEPTAQPSPEPLRPTESSFGTPAADPLPLIQPELLNPLKFRPPMSNPGGVNGDRPEREFDVITGAQIRDAGLSNAFEAVQLLRPNWFVNKDGRRFYLLEVQPDVYINGKWRDTMEALEKILATDISEVRYVRPERAKRLYGGSHPVGVIEITTRK